MAGNQPTYAFDPSGMSPANLIQNENHSVSAAAGKNLSFIIPRAAPFFRDNFQIVRVNGAVETPLVEGVDYVFALRYMEASIQTSKQVYGGVAFLNRNFAGSVRIKQYRTIGGTWVLDDYTATEQLTDSLYSVRTVYWDQLVTYPIAFPPYNHDHTMDDATGLLSLINKLEELRTTIASNPATAALAQLALHASSANAHTPAQVGLGNLNNYATATPVQTAQGLRSDLFVTPEGVAAAVAAVEGARGPRTIALTGDATASQTFNVDGDPWPSIPVTLSDAYKGIDTRAYPTSGVRGPDPDTELTPAFITNHANSPAGVSGTLADGTTRAQFFILNLRLKTASNDANAYARAQVAFEHRAVKADGVARTFVRYRENTAPYAWSAWNLISGQNIYTSYGKTYGNGTTTSGDVNAILDPVSRIKQHATTGGLPVGEYILLNYFDASYGVAVTAATPRVQMAMRVDAYSKGSLFTRYVTNGTTYGQWVNVAGKGILLANGQNVGALYEEGEYDFTNDGATDYATLGFPVIGTKSGRLTVIRSVGAAGAPDSAAAGLVTQVFNAYNSSAEWVRYYNTTPGWSAWVQTRLDDGSIPASALKTVPAFFGGGDAVVTKAAVRQTLELGNLAEYTLIESATEPVDPPAKCLWVVPLT